MTNPFIITAFSDELSKLANVQTETAGQLMGKLVKKVPLGHVASAGVGAGLLYGGHRLYKDIKAGEQLRKQQAGY